MPIDPGTLAGYDQLLSISQEAINQQLRVLYRTPVDPPIPNGPTHLINHEMHFHFKRTAKNGKILASKEGLDAYVCCPQIEFGGESISDSVDKYRVAVIRFKFRRAMDWEITDEEREKGKRDDSVLIYKEAYDQDENGNDLYEYPEVVINGWEISWATLIDKQDIQNVLEEIIKPAASTDSKVSISNGLKESLISVSSSNFQVSTIFCAMQSARLIQSFSLLDENGNVPTDIKNSKGEPVNNKNLVDELRNMLVSKFTPGKGVAHSPHGPTPDNPFVLGYTVSQKKPKLQSVNPAAATANIPTPAYFVPKSFRCNLSPKSAYCEGTLNYCMLTHRALEPPDFRDSGRERRIDDGVDGAGRFPQNVFARLKSKAQPGSTEGALFFCQDIFVNHWIGSSVAPLFYLSPETVAKKVADLIESKYKHLNIKGVMNFGTNSNLPSRTLSRNNEYKMTNTLRSGRKIISDNFIDDPTESIKLEYDTTVHVKYENLYDLRDDDEDLKRRLKFTIGSYTFIKLKFFRRLVTSHVGNFFKERISEVGSALGTGVVYVDYYGDSNWEEAYDANLWLNYRHTFEVGTSPKNSGSFTIENSKSEHLQADGQLIAHDGIPPDAGCTSPGLWKHTETYNWAKTFEFAFEDEKASLTSIGEETARTGATLFEGALDDLVKSLGTTVILPAGDVFMFKGMSADNDNNVFTTISYNTPIGGTVQTQAAKDVSSSRWEVPIKPAKA